MSGDSTSSVKDARARELQRLINVWQKDQEDSTYDPAPFLTKCSKILESELTEFRKGDPDPFDNRHPKYVRPNDAFGEVMTVFESRSQVSDKITSTYLKTTQSAKDVGPTVVAAARLALVATEGLDSKWSWLDDEVLRKSFFDWILDANEPLRTYATGLLNSSVEIQKNSNSEISKLIKVLLKRLWNYIEPGKFKERECSVSVPERVSNPHKRKLSADVCYPSPKKLATDKSKSVELENSNPDLIFENDLSNSSWAEQVPALIGCDYSLDFPLDVSICKRYIFNLLKGFGEFQDFLSVFLELKVIDLVNVYILNSKTDGQLTFKVLEFLSSILCHHKMATSFIDMNGMQNMLSVPRPSLGSTGVAFCLCTLAFKKEVMERVCQLPSVLLNEMVKYAIWLLECSHESGRSQTSQFFSLTLSYRTILSLFDKMNGLRCLINMISTCRPIMQFMSEDYDPLEDEELPYITSQIIRGVCTAMKKYFEAHLLLKASQAFKSVPALRQKYTYLENVSKFEPTRSEFFEILEALRELAEESTWTLDCWSPVSSFIRLEGVELLYVILYMMQELDATNINIEICRSILDVLCIVTLSRPARVLLTKKQACTKSNKNGLGIILELSYSAEDGNKDGVAQNSALAIVINCTTGPCGSESTDLEATKLTSTPKYKKRKKIKSTVCKIIQEIDGIKFLLGLLETKEPAQTADETRYLTCKALIGLSDYQPVRQILSKLPLFISGQLQNAFGEPVLQENKKIHQKLCKNMEILFQKVTGKAITLDADLNTVRKTDIVSETRVQYSNKEVLLMIHNHLLWSKLNTAADALAQEAGLFPEQNDAFDRFSTPKQPNRSNIFALESAGDGSFRQSRISFSRGNRASAETPTSAVLRTPVSQKRSIRIDTVSVYRPSNKGHDRYTLTRNGFVFVNPHIPDQNVSQVSLNSIVEEHFKHQHSKCRNPVVTVPQFSLFHQHYCPEPTNKYEASGNVCARLHSRQGICPKYGGVGGVNANLRLIYSRFRPGRCIKSSEDHKAPFTSVAFLPNQNGRLILGDNAGNLQIPGSYSQEDQLIEGISESAVTYLEPNHAGDVALAVCPAYWSSSHCCVLKTDDRIEQKFVIDNVDFAEFSKAVQDKIVGTRSSTAILFDANNGTPINSFQKDEIACGYRQNCATMSYDDKLILCDGLLWDIRKSETSPIHKFDKFNEVVSGTFHPNGMEVIINSEVWDLRNYNLLKTVPAFNLCQLQFNHNSNVIYAMKIATDQDNDLDTALKGLVPAFQTFDSSNYSRLAFVSVRQQVYSLALDDRDRDIAVIETSAHDDPAVSVCRFYGVGLERDDEEDVDGNFDARSSDDDDDDDGGSVNSNLGRSSSSTDDEDDLEEYFNSPLGGDVSDFLFSSESSRSDSSGGSQSGWETFEED